MDRKGQGRSVDATIAKKVRLGNAGKRTPSTGMVGTFWDSVKPASRPTGGRSFSWEPFAARDWQAAFSDASGRQPGERPVGHRKSSARFCGQLEQLRKASLFCRAKVATNRPKPRAIPAIAPAHGPENRAIESPRHDFFSHPPTRSPSWFRVEEGQDFPSHRDRRWFGVDCDAVFYDWMHYRSQQAGVDH